MASPTPRALINPALLIWARETSGISLEDAARKIGVTVERLQDWEAGTSRPTIRQLQEAARVYRRPFAAFYLPEPPTGFRVPHDFRLLPGGSARHYSPIALSELRRIQHQREVLLAIVEAGAPTECELVGTMTLDDDPERAAARARSVLGVSVEEQLSWRDPSKAFRSWRQALERRQILVSQLQGVDVDELRGFSIPHTEYPVVAVNNRDHPHGRIFTMMHELAHLMLNRPGICDLEEVQRPHTTDQRIEQLCNAFAAALLMPRSEMARRFPPVGHNRPTRWSGDDVESASRALGVSREAVVRRLVTIGATTFATYLQLRRTFQTEFEQQRAARKREKGGRGPTPAQSAIVRTGPMFARIVLDAYDREVITGADLTDYLGVRMKHIPRIRKLAAER